MTESDAERLLHHHGTEDTTRKPCIPYRYCLVALLFFGFFNALSTRYCFNIAIVAMVNHSVPESNSTSDECAHLHSQATNLTQQSAGEFNWDGTTESVLLASFFYGYAFTQLPGGYLAEQIGTKYVFGASILLPSIFSLLTPSVARWSPKMLIALRILSGLAQGPLFPSCFAMIGVWAPPYERTQMTMLSIMGAQLGTVVSLLLTGYLCSLTFLGGWPLPFYLFGIAGILWFLLWIALAKNSPDEHPGLTSYERNYIRTSLASSGKRGESRKRPWRQILFSRSTLAVYGASLFDGIGYNGFSSSFAVYLSQILKFDMTQNGIINATPYLFHALLSGLAGSTADWLRRNHMSTTATRKLFTFIGTPFVLQAQMAGIGGTPFGKKSKAGGILLGFTIGIGFVDCNRMAAVGFFFVCQAASGVGGSGFFANPIDLAPAFAGTVFGVANIFASIGGFVSPMVIGLVTDESTNSKEWSWVFFGMAGCYFMAIVIYTVFGSGEEQAWAKDSTSQSPTMEYTIQAQDSLYASASQNEYDS